MTQMTSSKKKAKKASRSSTKKTWVCEHGCKMTSRPCIHLERLITDHPTEPRLESVRRYAGNVDTSLKSYYSSHKLTI